MKIVYSEIPDESPLVHFFIDSGLEYSESDEISTDAVKCWKAEEDGELVGGCVLAKRQGRFICDGIATAPSVRGQGVGEKLLHLMLDEAKERGGNALYLVARAPGFFAKFGFDEVSPEEAPVFFECFTCPQYGVNCFPKVMRRTL